MVTILYRCIYVYRYYICIKGTTISDVQFWVKLIRSLYFYPDFVAVEKYNLESSHFIIKLVILIYGVKIHVISQL